MTNRIVRGAVCALLLGTAAVATAAPVCDGSLAREYAQRANSAGSTCHSFVTRFGPSMYNTDECYVMDRYVGMAVKALEALKAKGCVQMDNGPTTGEVAYAVWLGREFTKLRGAVWDEHRGWVYAK